MSLEVLLLFLCSGIIKVILRLSDLYKFVRVPCETIWLVLFYSGTLLTSFSIFSMTLVLFRLSVSTGVNFGKFYFSKKLFSSSKFSNLFA